MKVFWSWQSDSPGKIGRHFVRDVLEEAIKELKETPEFGIVKSKGLELGCISIRIERGFPAAPT